MQKKNISSSLPIPLSKYTLRDKLSLLFDLQSYSSHMVCIPYKLHLLLFFKNAILYIIALYIFNKPYLSTYR